MNRNTDDQKNNTDTQGHMIKPKGIDEADTEGNSYRGKGGIEEADTQGHAARFKGVDEADTDGHAARWRPEDKTDEADTLGHAGRFRP